MNYDPKNDAHKLSNYKQWKRKHNFITSVEIDLSKLGVKQEVMKVLFEGIVLSFKHNLIFSLYSVDPQSVVVFNPGNLQGVQKDTIFKYASKEQMINAIKIVLLTHHHIYIHQDELPNKIILLDA